MSDFETKTWAHWARLYCAWCGGWHALGLGVPLQEDGGEDRDG